MHITTRQVEAAYAVANRVFDREITIEVGANELHGIHGLNQTSAIQYINGFASMLRGKVFKRSMNIQATDYFLTRIAEERGQPALKAALASLELHISYYEGLRQEHLPGLRALVIRHQSAVKPPVSLTNLMIEFEASVRKSLADPSSKRLARLKAAPTTPVKIKVFAEVYVRNQDVAAEVLLRASGVCERCRKPAPFKKTKDGKPYLEVHHKEQLSVGGEDTVENAIALCPNCHRELHFGV